MTSNRWAGVSIFSFKVFPLFLGIPRCPEAEVGVTGSEVASILVDGEIPSFIYATGSGLPEMGWPPSWALGP